MREIEIVKKLQEAGFEAYFVGGFVRDSLIGIESDDIDIVTSARTHEIQKVFPDCKPGLGTKFLVNLVQGIEISTYRFDYEENGEKIFLFSECFKEDSARRDLTINAIGYDPIKDIYIDHWDGKKDIENKIIRFVGVAETRIQEDPVRMIRACRFAAKIEGRLIPSAFFAIKDNTNLIKAVPKERIQKEILKAMKLRKPSIFFELLHRTGLLNKIIPEMDDCWHFTGGNYHSEFIHEHLLECGDALSSEDPILRLAGYLHDIGKSQSYNEETFSFIGHESVGSNLVNDILKDLKFSLEDTRRVVSLVKNHMRCIETNSSKKSYRRLISKLQKNNVNIQDFLNLKISDRYANKIRDNYSQEEINTFRNNFENCYQQEYVFGVKDLKINGFDLIKIGIKPGKKLGALLSECLNVVIDDPELNDKEYLLQMVKNINQNKGEV